MNGSSKDVLHAVSTVIVLIGLFFSTSAHASQVDLDALDTIKTTSRGPLGILAWPGVSLRLSRPFDQPVADILTAGAVRVDDARSFVLDRPQATSLTRIVTSARGAPMLEHVEIVIDDVAPSLRVTARSSVRLVEVALFQAAPFARPVPIYAFKRDAKHIGFVVAATGQAIERNVTEASCKSSRAKQCTFGQPTWHEALVDFVIGPEQSVAQARGEVVYEATSEKNAAAPEALTFVVNASFTQTARDLRPVVTVNARTMATVFTGDGEE